MQNNLIRILAILLGIITTTIYVNSLIQDRFVVQTLFYDITNPKNTNSVLNGLPNYQLIEKAGVELYNYQIKNTKVNCGEIEEFGNKLIQINKRSSQGYYLLTACAELKGNQEEALKYIENAIKYDHLNTQYLLGAAILNMNSNKLEIAKTYLDKIKVIDPETINYNKILEIYEQKKLSNSDPITD